MKRHFTLLFTGLLILIFIAGCSKNNGPTNPPPTETGPRYIAVGSGAYYSVDANNWVSLSTYIPGHFEEVAYGNGIFVAIYKSNNQNYAARSTNGGINWETHEFSSAQQIDMNHLVFENGNFLIAATCRVSSVKTVGELYSSTDGLNWNGRVIDFDNCWTNEGITFGNGNYVVTGSNGGSGACVWYSATLETFQWTQCAYISDFIAEDLDFSNGRFITVGYYGGSQGKAFYSDNLSTYDWTQVTVCWGGSSASVQHLDFGNNVWIATYLFGTTICVSNDNGINWQAVQLGGSGNINNVSFVNGRFIAVGTNRILTSTDATVWNEIPSQNWGELFHVTYGQ